MGALAWASSSDAFCFASTATPGLLPHVSNTGPCTQNILLRSTASSSRFREEDPERLWLCLRELSRRGEQQHEECPVQNWHMLGADTSPGTDVSLAPWVSVWAEHRKENEERLQSPGSLTHCFVLAWERGRQGFHFCTWSFRKVLLSPVSQALSPLPFLPAGLSPAEQSGELGQESVLMSARGTK